MGAAQYIETTARYGPGANKQHAQGAVKNEPLMSTDRERKNDVIYCLLSPGSAGSTSTVQINVQRHRPRSCKSGILPRSLLERLTSSLRLSG